MRVLGIDPGSHKTGWGIVDVQGTRLRHVASGTIVARGEVIADRLLIIARELEEVIAEHVPEAASVESLFFSKDSQAALKLGHARGVAVLCVARAGVPLFEYPPAVIKKAVTANGRAAKAQVQQMVKRLLGFRGELGLDASDALAAAICHSHSSPTRRALEAAVEAERRATKKRRRR